jgi:hypothetical protein
MMIPSGQINSVTLYRDSSLREKIIEHVFIGELLRALWRTGQYDVEVLRAEVDRGGYDLVLECRGVLRHVQFKSSHRGSKVNEVSVSLKLADKASGCIIWLMFDQETLELGPFLWFGAMPGKKLPALGDKVARHSKGDSLGRKAERPNHRLLKRSSFARLDTTEAVALALFGEAGGLYEKTAPVKVPSAACTGTCTSCCPTDRTSP